MKTTLLATLLSLTTLFTTISAVPAAANDIRKRDVVRRQLQPNHFFPRQAPRIIFATGAFPTAAGTGLRNWPAATGAAIASTAGVPCTEEEGAVVCNGAKQWGQCGAGRVTFGPTVDGTSCIGGRIVDDSDPAATNETEAPSGMEEASA